MHDFSYRNGVLHCEGIPLTDVIKEYPTPFYLYSRHTVLDHFTKIQNAFKELDPLICFSTELAVMESLTAVIIIRSDADMVPAPLVINDPP